MAAPLQQLELLKASSFASHRVGKLSVQPQIAPSLAAASNSIPLKPMRPLTAYHIFFQIERELIIQTSEGEIANKSSLDNKVYLDDVPQRYKNIRLLPDWYAGPGKRKKRKHRKQHGKIGFLELSRVISARWAELDVIDPETKAFVQKIAQTEIDEYYRDMKRYKELTKGMLPMMSNLTAGPAAVPKRSAEKRSSYVMSNSEDISSEMQPQQASCPDMIATSLELMQLQIQLQSEIDHFLSCIEKRKQELLSSHFAAKKSQLKISNQVPLPYQFEKPVQKKMKTFHRQDSSMSELSYANSLEMSRTVSADSTASLSTCTDELEIGDDEIINFWKTCNNN
ncbi:hypothetical protein ACHAXA_003610 [Cyclostephanos tholiformis]|uniref:HMG box domain-containing protein n=1 Tax=Cyclostephanos tholiformis TaxID=382380 RepID=A0ABD3SQ95_9STRA